MIKTEAALGFEYHDLPNRFKGEMSETERKIEAAHKVLLQKAKFISKRLQTNYDQDQYQKLMTEKKFVESIAELIDRIRLMTEFFEATMDNTSEDFFRQAIDGKKLGEKLMLQSGTIQLHFDREDKYLQIIKSQQKKINELTKASANNRRA